MMTFLYPLLVLADLSMWLVALLLVNWWAPLFASKDGWLPPWLSWFQTFDAPLDAGWRDGYFNIAARRWWVLPIFCYAGSTPPTGLNLFCLRVRWLYRNPAYGFDYWVLGIVFVASAWTVHSWGVFPDREFFIATGQGRFNLYYQGKWGTYKLGWKAWNYWDDGAWKTKPFGPDWIAPLAATVNPFKKKAPAQ